MRVDADDPRAREERRVTRVLELAEELLGLRRELEAAMRSGLFDIAAARYARPSCPVSRTQYDLNMRAQTRVATRARNPPRKPDATKPPGASSPSSARTNRADATTTTTPAKTNPAKVREGERTRRASTRRKTKRHKKKQRKPKRRERRPPRRAPRGRRRR